MSERSPFRAAGLDAIRAAAIALVLVHHFRHLPGAPDALRWFGLRGYVGVDLFFVLSGWLIGGQLWRELARTGTLAVGTFWRRRWLRTLPSYLAMLVVLFGIGRIGASDLPIMAVFLQNYLAAGKWFATWSLCIEEHFYFALPLIVLAALRLRTNRRAVAWTAAVVAIALAPLLRLVASPALAHASYDEFLGNFYGRTHLRFDGLALGVAFAGLAAHRHAVWQWLERHRSRVGLAGLALVLSHWVPALTGSTADVRERLAFYPAVPDFLVVSLGVALLLPWAKAWTAPRPVAKALQVVADHAYALYLTHELARDAVVKALDGRTLPFAAWFALALATSVGAAMLLRQLAEKPGLAWRERRQAAARVAPES